VSLESIEAYPWFLNKRLDLMVNDNLVHTRFNAGEWMDHWRPLLARLLELWTAAKPRRYLVAIAGPPGSGKSVLAEQLHWLIERGLLGKEMHSVALPMDGFHYPNAHLQTHFRSLPDGTRIPLDSVKGQPDTFDVKALRQHLKMLVGRPDYMEWPGYSRFTHDVVPNKFHIHYSANFVIVEGNYILVDRGPFAGIPDLFDLKIYIDGPAPKIISNLVERHIAGGKTVDEAKEWVRRIDLPNARIAESTKANADLIIERDGDDDLSALKWREKPAVAAPASTTAATAAAAAMQIPGPSAPPQA
jgi:pantothenate kinase